MTREKNNLLDISSDITINSLILGMILIAIKKTFGPEESLILVSFLGASSLWKLASPFSNPEQIGSKRYLWVLFLVVLILAIPAIIMFL